MKKTLALVLALAMVFSTITVAFAEGTIGADAQICADLGMLKGSTGTVDAAYVATAPTRIQAAVMFLRLKGLEADAMAFKGDANFADADTAAWAKPVMAYLKANPQLGWAGDGKNFNPTNTVTAKEYYKVLLETLGYKQNTAEVVGDFTWDNVVEFAAGKGLTKVAAVTNYTVNDLAIATVEALKLNVKDATKTLVASLVEAGKVDAAKATTAGIYTTAAAAALDAVTATANDKVEVTFDADVDKAFAENVANYKIVAKGTTTALEVKSAKAVGTTMAELTTAVQTAGGAYTLTVGSVSKNFAGDAKITGAPEIDTVTCIDTNTVEVVFKKAMDRASVEDVANYTLNNSATVKAAELWIDQDDSRMTVKLTTDGVVNNKVYKLKVANVKSADLVAIKTVEKSFAGVTDVKAATIKGNVKVMNNQRIQITFDDKHGVDKASAENLANWSIEGLTITKATARDVDGDDYAYYEVVELDTEPMTANHKYTVTVSNLVDGSSSKNVIAKALTKTFYGVAIDKTAPKAGTISVLGDNMVEIVYTETNRLDQVSATDVNNYTFTEGLQVLSASIIRPAKPDTGLGKTVVLTTSTMDTDTTYKLTIENVADEFGNVMTKLNNRSLARSKGQDIAAPAVLKVEWADKNTVKVYFDERLDVDSANDPANFSINGDIGVVKKAELSGASGYTRVDLTTPDLVNNKAYKVTINGVKDRLGNEMSGYTASFTSGMKSADTDKPVIENIVAVNENEIRVTFDEPVNATGAAMTFVAGTGVPANAAVAGVATSLFTIDDGTTVVFIPNTAIGTTDEITINTITGVKDMHNNTYVVDATDKPTFYGSVDDNEAPEVVAIDQLTTKKIQVTFSEPVRVTGLVDGVTPVVDVDDDETTDALSVITITYGANIAYEKKFTYNFTNIKDYSGTSSTDTSYEYIAYLDDQDNPTIDYVEAVSTTKVKVHFNESMDTAGSYIVKDSDEKTVALTGLVAAVDGDDDTIVNVTFQNPSTSWKVKPGDVYSLVPKTAARDIKGNPVENLSDLSFDFVASAVVNYSYIKGVKIVDAKTIDVSFTSAQTNPATTITIKADATGAPEMFNAIVNDADGVATNGTSTWRVTLLTPLLDGVDYIVDTNNHDALTFSGVLSDGGLDVDVIQNATPATTNEYITFSGFDNTYVVNVVYGGVTSAALTMTTVGGVDLGFDAFATLNGFGTVADTATDYVYTVEVRRAVGEAVLYSKEFTR